MNDPKVMWQLMETVDGIERPFDLWPHLYANLDDLMPAVEAARYRGYDVAIRKVIFTKAKAVTAIVYGNALPERVQQVGGWDDETMQRISRAAELRIKART